MRALVQRESLDFVQMRSLPDLTYLDVYGRVPGRQEGSDRLSAIERERDV